MEIFSPTLLREVKDGFDFPIYMTHRSAPKTPIQARVLHSLATAPLLKLLHPEHRRASANIRAGLWNPSHL